jgi:hypothetical protein
MYSAEDVEARIERLRETAYYVSPEDVSAVEKEASRFLGEVAGISLKALSAAEDVHDAFADLIRAVKRDEPDVEFKRGRLLHHIDGLEAILHGELASRTIPA